LIPEHQRYLAVELIQEAVTARARLFKACEVLEISTSTFRRWKRGDIRDKRKGADKHVPRKLNEAERDEIIKICCDDEYKDKNPYYIHATLLDKGIYIASISSFYRVLRENGLVKHRGNSRPASKNNKPPEKKATGPNQVWCWDITWLKTEVRGIFFFAYVIIDIWDRSIVKWSIHDREDEALARELFELAVRDNGRPDVFIHSDNGNPMKGVSLLAFFKMMGLSNSYSRPRVSNDNPFIESLFKTLKYHVSYPKAFADLVTARKWFADFVDVYNNRHYHSGLHFITPNAVRKGKYKQIVDNRNSIMMEAFSRNPHRWSKPVKQLPVDHIVYLNPSADTRLKIRNKDNNAA
jgi:putative transposase